jgi:hypothetical protein
MNNQIHSETSIGWLNSLTSGVRRAVKTFGFTALLVGSGLALTNTAQAQLSVGDALWKVEAGSVAWLSDAGNQVRGAAFNPATGNLLVASRAGGTNRIEIVSAETGVSSGTLASPEGGFTGGFVPINRVAVTDDGQIFASNFILSSSSDYKVYYWANEAATPVVLFNGNPSPAARYGDGIGVTGTGTDVTFYAGGTGTPSFAKFNFNGTEFSEAEIFTLGSDFTNASIVAVPGSNYLWLGSRDNETIKYDTVLDSIVTVIPNSIIPTSYGDLAYKEINGRKLLLTGVPAVENANFLVVDVTDEANPYVVAQTGSIGFGENTFRVGAAAFNNDGSRIYVLATNTALAAYNIQDALNTELVNVTFTLNTSTLPDTVTAASYMMHVNGTIRNRGTEFISGETLGWDANATATLTNIGGDYWQSTFTMIKGDTLLYKYRWSTPSNGDNSDEQEWATASNPVGWGTRFAIPNADTTLSVDYWYDRSKAEGRAGYDNAPFETKADTVALFFRVNVGSLVQSNAFDPNNETHVVELRGNLNDWSGNIINLMPEAHKEGTNNYFYSAAVYLSADSLANLPTGLRYKYAINIPGQDLGWEGSVGPFDGNRGFNKPSTDTTTYFSYINNERPAVGEIFEGNLQFSVNVGVLEDLALFNRAVGDRTEIRSGLGDVALNFEDALNAWTGSTSFTRAEGASIWYKNFLIWDASRFDSESPNYIAGLDANNGWEEPGSTGGGNRNYTFTQGGNTSVSGDLGANTQFFNSIPPQGVISSTFGGETELVVTFSVDMSHAVIAPEIAPENRFNPDQDTVFVIIDTPFFAITQGMPAGDSNPILSDQTNLSRVQMTRVGTTNTFELDLPLMLPTENHIGFRLAYRNGEKQFVHNISFDPGRRYYRYVTPLDTSDPDNIIWPDTYELAPIVFKSGPGYTDNGGELLDFPAPPDYGLGVSVLRPGTTPDRFTLHNNYPNPFNPTTRISFTIPMTDNVQVDVFNVLGQRVATLVNGVMPAGTHTLTFNAASLASGVYIYRIQSGNFIQAKSMMLVK